MKSFYTKTQSYNEAAHELDKEIYNALFPIYEKWKEECPLYEIFALMSSTVFTLMVMNKTKIRRTRPTQDTIKDN